MSREEPVLDDDDDHLHAADDVADDAADPDWLPEDEVSAGPEDNAEINTDAK